MKDKIPMEALEITLATLREMPEIHYKSCYEDSSGRPEYNCSCPLKKVEGAIIKRLREELEDMPVELRNALKAEEER
jgi:hypothetical protein